MKKKFTIILTSSLFLILASLALLGMTYGWFTMQTTFPSGVVSVGDLSYTQNGSLITDNSIVVPGQNIVSESLYFGNASSLDSQMRLKVTYTQITLENTPTNNHIVSLTTVYNYYPCWTNGGNDYILDSSGNLVEKANPAVIIIAAAALPSLYVGEIGASDIVNGASTYTFFRAWTNSEIDYILDGSGNLVLKSDPLTIVISSANLLFVTPNNDQIYRGEVSDHLAVTFLSEYYFSARELRSDIIDFAGTITYTYQPKWVKESVHYLLDINGNLVSEANPSVIIIASEDLEDLYQGVEGESDIFNDPDTYTFYPSWVASATTYVLDISNNLVERDSPANIEIEATAMQGEFVLGDGDLVPDEADDDYWYFGSADTIIPENSGIIRLIRKIQYDGAKASNDYSGQPIQIAIEIQVKQSDHVSWSDLTSIDFETGYPVS
ncbi:MAG: hypothetical protein GX582_05830 [Acholeplasmataceae bacterium]|nr:hypothetical protein [Acholeplasmataceae bacterium]